MGLKKEINGIFLKQFINENFPHEGNVYRENMLL